MLRARPVPSAALALALLAALGFGECPAPARVPAERAPVVFLEEVWSDPVETTTTLAWIHASGEVLLSVTTRERRSPERVLDSEAIHVHVGRERVAALQRELRRLDAFREARSTPRPLGEIPVTSHRRWTSVTLFEELPGALRLGAVFAVGPAVEPTPEAEAALEAIRSFLAEVLPAERAGAFAPAS